MILKFLPLLLLLSACEDGSNALSTKWQEISGRDERLLTYRVRVPAEWGRKDPDQSDRLLDTMKPLCEFVIHENEWRFSHHLLSF
jgi:hypothetical protein